MLVDLQATPRGRLRAVLRFDHPRRILIELSVNPAGGETPSSHEIARILTTIGDDQFTHFVETSTAGNQVDWNAVMAFATCCHNAVSSVSRHVITTVRIEDEGAAGEAAIEAAHPAVSAQVAGRARSAVARAGGHSFEL